MKQLFVALLCAFGLAGYALDQTNYAPKITDWKEVPGQQHIEPGAGIDGEPALVYERTDKESYSFTETPVANLKPNKRYHVGVYVKTAGMPKTHGGATCAIEYGQPGRKHAGGVWPEGTTDAKDWTLVEDTVTALDNACDFRMLLYMRHGASGKAYFCRPFIYEAKPLVTMDIISPISKYAMKPGKTDLVFGVFSEGLQLDGTSFTLTISRDAKEYASATAKLQNCRLVFKNFNFTPGKYVASVNSAIEDAVDVIPPMDFTVLPANSKPASGNHVTVAPDGRIFLNGKPFLPIGIYANQTDKLEDMQAWAKAGFNCVMPYNAIWWKRCEKAPEKAADKVAEVRKALDDLNTTGVKILFSLKDIHPGTWDKYGELNDHAQITELLVSSLKDHPTILGWYLNDEIESNDFYRDFRKRVSDTDPFHPTFQVQCRLNTMARTVGYGDVFMVDPYPFNKPEDGSENCRNFMKRATDVFGPQVLAVPQAFPWYQYRKNPKDTFYPTNEQMRGHIILEAAMGAKGFILYTYFAAKRHKDKTGIDRWPDIVALASMLHSLEPFILSTDKAPDFLLKTTNGEVYAKTFASSGKAVALLAGLSGKTTAELYLPALPNLKSRYGLTKNLGKGHYLYEANGCNGDILVMGQ